MVVERDLSYVVGDATPHERHRLNLFTPETDATPWKRCMSVLSGKLTDQQFSTWIRPLQAMHEDAALRLLAPNRFVVDWIRAQLIGS